MAVYQCAAVIVLGSGSNTLVVESRARRMGDVRRLKQIFHAS